MSHLSAGGHLYKYVNGIDLVPFHPVHTILWRLKCIDKHLKTNRPWTNSSCIHRQVAEGTRLLYCAAMFVSDDRRTADDNGFVECFGEHACDDSNLSGLDCSTAVHRYRPSQTDENEVEREADPSVGDHLHRRRMQTDDSCVQCHRQASDTYVPSWFKNRSRLDMKREAPKLAENRHTPRGCKELDSNSVDGLERSVRGKGAVSNRNKHDIQGTKHSALEQEYISLKQQLPSSSVHGGVTRTDERGRSRVKPSVKVPPGTNKSEKSEIPTRDMLHSDDLGIDHFQKHIMNVKMVLNNSCRHVKHGHGKYRKRGKCSFRPLFERSVTPDTPFVMSNHTANLRCFSDSP